MDTTAALVEGAIQSPLPVPFPDVPFQKFVLDNGLALIVHEDRRAPLIATELRYKVGSKDEPPGRHGFAHLFEHLMFKGSANHQRDWHTAVADLGGMNVNGSTNADRTNYYQTVPTGAIDTILWMESDRMQNLLGGLTAESLATEIEVVKNEKRQREGQPLGGLVELIAHNLYPANHPYAHTTLGSFEDLGNATLETARDWFKAWYGPANAVLVLAGDISPQEALDKVTHWFGSIPSGRIGSRHSFWVPPNLGARRLRMIEDIPTTHWIRVWSAPGYGTEDGVYLHLLAQAMTGTTSTELRRRLVEKDRLCHDVSANYRNCILSGEFIIRAALCHGVDVSSVETIIEEELSRLIEFGPSSDELGYHLRNDRVGFSLMQENLAAKAHLLADSECSLGAPDAYRRIARISDNATPEDVARAARSWLLQDALTIEAVPVHRSSVKVDEPDRSVAPAPKPIKLSAFPKVERATLSNGVEVVLVNRPNSGSVAARLMIQGGSGNDALGEEGLTNFTISLMGAGTKRHAKHDYRALQRQLNAKIHGSSGLERVAISTVIQPNALAPVFKMMAEYALEPAYPRADFEHARQTALTGLQMRREPASTVATRFSRQLTYGINHLYSREHGGTIESVEALSLERIVARHAELFRPHGATVYLVGDVGLGDAVDALRAAFESWSAPSGEFPILDIPFAPRTGRYLVDGPNEPQSNVAFTGAFPELSYSLFEKDFVLEIFSYTLGGSYGSRLNRALRAERGWTYNVNIGISRMRDLAAFGISTAVQADKTMETVEEIERQLRALGSAAPISAEEVDIAKGAMLLQMPGQWASNEAVLSALIAQKIHGWPDGYYDGAADRLEKVTVDDLTEVSTILQDVDRMNIVIAGDSRRFSCEGLTRLDRNAHTI